MIATRRLLLLLALCALPACMATAQMEATSDGETPLEEAGELEAPGWDAEAIDPVPPEATERVEAQTQVQPLPPEGLEAVNTLYRSRVSEPSETPSATAARTEEPERAQGFPYYLQAFSALLVLCGVIILLGYLARTLGRRTPLLAGQRYGNVIGRVALTPRASLHFVRTADRVLVVGVTPQSVSLISEFPQDAFESELASETKDPAASDFLSQLRSAAQAPATPEPDEELSALRGDLQRLQRYLKQHAESPEL